MNLADAMRRMSWLAFAAVLAAGVCNSALAQSRIQALSASVQSGTEVVRIELDDPPQAIPEGFLVQSPARIALDFPGVTNGTGSKQITLNLRNLRSASIAEVGSRTRVVLNLNRPTTYQIAVEGNAILLVLDQGAAMQVPQAEQVFAEPQPHHASVETPLHDIDFRRGVDNAGRVIVDLDNDQVGVDIQRQGNRLLVDFLETTLPQGLRRRLDVSDFGTPVQTVTTTQSGDRVRMIIESAGDWEHSAYQSNSQLVVEVHQQKADPNRLVSGSGPGFRGEKLSLNFQDISVRSLLQVIADFTDFNVVTSDSVEGNLTLRLKDVPWDQALQIILDARDLGMKREGNVLMIEPKVEMAAKEQAELEARANMEDLQPLQTESFQLNYTKATEIRDQLTSFGGSGSVGGQSGRTLLSDRGSVVIDVRTNQVFISDIPSRLEQIRTMIGKLDIPIRQVLIEARIVEATDTFGKSLGVRLGGADLRGIRGGDAGYRISGNNRVAFGGNYNAIANTTGQSNAGLTTTSSQFVNLPAVGFNGMDPANFAISLFSSRANRFLNLELSALEADGRGRVISSPRVVTGDQTKASIEQGTDIPYQEATSSGATSISFRKAVLKLEVLPQITPEGNIILDLDVNKDTPGQIVPGGVAINTKHVSTQVLVENGGTVVIGGIFELTEQRNEEKVPLLGDIPAVGNLFKTRTRTADKTEMMVFITPKILTEGGLIR